MEGWRPASFLAMQTAHTHARCLSPPSPSPWHLGTFCQGETKLMERIRCQSPSSPGMSLGGLLRSAGSSSPAGAARTPVLCWRRFLRPKFGPFHPRGSRDAGGATGNTAGCGAQPGGPSGVYKTPLQLAHRATSLGCSGDLLGPHPLKLPALSGGGRSR